ncbi:uncharacterized protein LOC123699305 [Colias croceus]|uniref:uncharacterized protein LOC123699305 n=1 Tax=Colias crocea TaxID=72248 RepID=UPI001E2813DC|nr:uncharacterized protein LOC123699305 [Colias croceus]
MVLTRSRANSIGHSEQRPNTHPVVAEQYDGSLPSTSHGSAVPVDVRTSTPPLAGPMSAGVSAPSPPPLYGRESPDYLPRSQHGRAPPVASPQPPASAPVLLSDQQFVYLLQALRQPPYQAAPPPSSTVSNLSNCSSRFNGEGDIMAFIDAVQIYKDCLGVSNDMALRGLPMLLQGFAATWWQGVKHSISSWDEALHLLRQTFGPRLPPHKVYREVFSREQTDEKTDVFVCRIRSLFAQLPPNTLPENPVQLDMVYGLLHRRIRERVPRTIFASFSELLQHARVVEDIFDEVRATAPVKENTYIPVTPALVVQSPLIQTPSTSTSIPSSSNTPPNNRQRLRCSYCKTYGHNIGDCRKLSQRRLASEPVKKETALSPELLEPRPAITCFGCGAPGVVRSNCEVCKERRSAPMPSTSSFQSIVADISVFKPCVRPIFSVEVYNTIGTALLDTGAKQSVASVSLTRCLRANGQVFKSIETELKFADGTRRVEIVETALVNVKVHGVAITTLFIVLPGATDSLLGMNFIRDAGMVLDFFNNKYSMRSTTFFELKYERDDHVVARSAMVLRECETTLLTDVDKNKLTTILEDNSGIFSSGGGPTSIAVNKIEPNQGMGRSGAIISDTNYLPNKTPYLQVKGRIDHPQDFRERAADKDRRLSPTYKEGALVLVETHRPNKAFRGFTSKFAPKREGPSKISKCVSSTTYEVVDNNNTFRGKYHVSLLNPYTGVSTPIVHGRRRGRPKQKQSPKPAPDIATDLEGEDIAQGNAATPRASRIRKPPVRYRDAS